jgi:dCTP deaminase
LILTGKKIEQEIRNKNILIEPYREDCIGPNSYDVHLGRHIIMYTDRVLDAKTENEIEEIIIPPEGIILHPGTMYLGVTEEYTESRIYVPFLEGISSAARLGIKINPSSGKGSIGHANTWTIEMDVIQPVRVYAGMPIAQLIFFAPSGDFDVYASKVNPKYGYRSIKPVPSMMWKNKF